MTHFETLLVASSLLLVYALASVRFSKAIQPIRIRLVDEIAELCEIPEVPDEVKDDLKALERLLFSKKAAWFIVFYFPFIVFQTKVRGKSYRTPTNYAHKPKILLTMGIGLFCIIAASPLGLVIFGIEFILGMFLAAPLSWVRSLIHRVALVERVPASTTGA